MASLRRPRPTAATVTVARSYGPLVAAALAFLVMATVVRPLPRPVERLTASETGDGATVTPGATELQPGEVGPAGDGARSGGPARRGSGRVPTRAAACPDRVEQVPGDPYSPPCLAFAGDNGGITARGVTDKEIVISIRELEGPTAAEIFSDISGQDVNDSPEAYRNTLQALADYFSTRFQFYGRRLRIAYFKGQGSGATELLGGGQEKALADAIRASQELGAFADISALTIPYADSLTRHKVVNIGAPYPSRQWFVEHRPYAWSIFVDSTNAVEAHSSWILARLKGVPTQYAGDEFNGKPRKYALIGPENDIYQQAAQSYIGKLREGGIDVSMNVKYKLDLASMPNQASNIIAQIKDAGITSVLCGCDPVMMALGLTPKANEQDYHPEWITAGLAFVEQDLVGQLIDQKQWAHAFGIAYNAESEPQGRSYPYAAYKQIRPNDEPAFGVEELYYQLYLLAIGIHMAGPTLTPESFEAGMFAYPRALGPRGSWGFGPGDYTPMDDFREIWWDADRVSPQNNKPGAWVALDRGARYFPGQVPRNPTSFFED